MIRRFGENFSSAYSQTLNGQEKQELFE